MILIKVMHEFCKAELIGAILQNITQVISFHYAIFSVPCTLTDLMVTKRKDSTRSHPEHGRKDFHRRQYSEGSLPGR